MKLKKTIIIAVVALFFVACNPPFPRPYGYFRIEIPKADYKLSVTDLPCSFDQSSHANVTPNSYRKEKKNWIDIDYPQFGARIHCSYNAIKPAEFMEISEESRQLAYKHTVKAEAINEHFYENDEKKVYGMLYDIRGNAASPAQFFVTDSCSHFFRGALYFNTLPNTDSIAPVFDFIYNDMLRMIETFEWKK